MPNPSSSAVAAVDQMRHLVRWCLVAAVTFVTGQADTLFLHAGLTYGTLVTVTGPIA